MSKRRPVGGASPKRSIHRKPNVKRRKPHGSKCEICTPIDPKPINDRRENSNQCQNGCGNWVARPGYWCNECETQ